MPISKTKEQLIKDARNSLEQRKKDYDEFCKGSKAFEENCKNKKYVEYLKNNFLQEYNKTDEELYVTSIEGYEADEIDENCGIISTYNPNSKWDWYSVGGRWKGLLLVKSDTTDSKEGKPGVFEMISGESKPNKAPDGYSGLMLPDKRCSME